jgi:hypothetical protein
MNNLPTFALPEKKLTAPKEQRSDLDWYLSYIYDSIHTQDVLWDWDNQDRDNFHEQWGAEKVSRWRPHRDERRLKTRTKTQHKRTKNSGKKNPIKLV